MLRISIVTKSDTTRWEVGEGVLSAFLEQDLTPESLFHWESRIGDFKSVNDCRQYWAALAEVRVNGSMMEFPLGLRWKRKKVVKYDAEIKHTQRDAKGQLVNGSLNVEAQPHKKVDWLTMFREICSSMSPDFGVLHIFSDFECVNSGLGTAESYFLSGVNVSGSIANVGWAMFFGGEFVREVDEEKIADSGFPIEILAGGYLIRVTSRIQDVIDNFPMFSKRRAELKSLFREDLFMIRAEPNK